MILSVVFPIASVHDSFIRHIQELNMTENMFAGMHNSLLLALETTCSS